MSTVIFTLDIDKKDIKKSKCMEAIAYHTKPHISIQKELNFEQTLDDILAEKRMKEALRKLADE